MSIKVTVTCLSGLMLLAACSKDPSKASSSGTSNAAPAALQLPKPGLWEMAVTADGMPGQVKTQVCVGAPAPGANPFAPPPQAGQTCAKSSFTKTSDGYAVDMQCAVSGMTVASTGTVTGDFSSSYKTVMKTKMSGPGIPAAMQTERTSTVQSTYLGACPSGMQPNSVKAG